MSSDTSQPNTPQSQYHPSACAPQVGPDKRAVIEAMRAVEGRQHPDMLTLVYNGSAWLLYKAPRPEYLKSG